MNTGRILMVDDEESIRSTLRDYFYREEDINILTSIKGIGDKTRRQFSY